jgi:hypothetical protein
LTIIECEECETKMINHDYDSRNACGVCTCENIQVIHIESAPPTKLKGFITVRYRRSYPKIYEISELDRILAEKAEGKEKTKKLGFGES